MLKIFETKKQICIPFSKCIEIQKEFAAVTMDEIITITKDVNAKSSRLAETTKMARRIIPASLVTGEVISLISKPVFADTGAEMFRSLQGEIQGFAVSVIVIVTILGLMESATKHDADMGKTVLTSGVVLTVLVYFIPKLLATVSGGM